MAKVSDCGFCGHTTIGICPCVIRFGKEIEEKIKAWKLVQKGKPFPPSLKEALASET